MNWMTGVLVLLMATTGGAQTIGPTTPSYILYTQLGTGSVTHAMLACIDDGGGPAIGCSGGTHDAPDDPRWTLRRCDSDGCEFQYPVTLDSPSKIHFNSTQPGTYYIFWFSGNYVAPKSAAAIVQRGPFQFPPSIGH
jgi:hypothetical protein